MVFASSSTRTAVPLPTRSPTNIGLVFEYTSGAGGTGTARRPGRRGDRDGEDRRRDPRP